ncbi:MAG TPA: crossover junction endodeoxyribonuclease RuvC [Chloroflexota bacterium]|jgi:crossover junction endodeoxyribonuclease RuvC|nr:crossover junction endodeoxyribonuclease RuvC [Chloroflexota bacterium]
MRALGIDPGLVRSGWAIVEPLGGRSVVLAHGVIAPPTDASLPARLADGAAKLRAVVAEFHPTFVALEEVFTAPQHPRSALLMAHMRGVICLVLEEAGIPILPLTATTVKQRLTSSGHASKEQVQKMVMRLTGMSSSAGMKLDETDAVALALAGLSQTVLGDQFPIVSTRSGGAAAIRERVNELLRSSADPKRRRTTQPPAPDPHV